MANYDKKSHSSKNKPAQTEDKNLKFQMQDLPKVAGPACIHCSDPINVKLGGRARNGYLHSRCEELVTRKPNELFQIAVNMGLVPQDALDA